MITHYIILSSSYSMGKRIGLHYVISDTSVYESLEYIVPTIIKECGEDVSISTHSIKSDTDTWESVVEKDSFFRDVELVNDLNKFIELIKQDRKLKGVDIAKYIISKIKCTHLKLEKLVYLCYAEYLCKTGKKLFEDKIFAYKLGPVVDSVYKKYKIYGKKQLRNVEIASTQKSEMPSKSRILFAEDGISKVSIIDETLEKYGKLTATELVDLTHIQNSPWSKTISYIFTKNIKDEIIQEYHKFEKVV